ncbi:alpha/beta hydrolase [Anatilimnocola floriformis]|uniref:alpha/beta hydrolase n=1 Tax=Anatilimnocola floriformis TaxID=2948575 RepID=UPI0020C267AE|nr:alpha/beta fold hydrolase [Anatilimnocola floriformis]
MWFVVLLLICGQDASSAAAPDKRIAAATELTANLTAGKFDEVTSQFNLTMRLLLPAVQIRAVWEGTANAYGKFQKIGGTRATEADGYFIVFVTLEFARGKLDAKVVYDKNDRVSGLFFVPHGKYQRPEYVRADSFDEMEVKVGQSLFTLPGTLSLPKGEGPFPAVVLVHGSGPNDRDESFGPNKPFKDIAQGLASRGIAVLRYEKRTRQHPLNMLLLGNKLTVKEETIDDAAAAVDLLRAHDKLHKKRIFVLGHSLGGMLLPRIAEANKNIAGFISLAGATRPLEDIILEQTNYLLSLDGPPTAEMKKEIEKIERQIATAKSADLTLQTPSSDLPLGIPAGYWLDLRNYDPAAAAKKIDKPFLILQGERDYQVTMSDFARWRDALADRADAEFISYQALNHLFLAGEGKSSAVEYLTPGNVAPQVVADIAKWIDETR